MTRHTSILAYKTIKDNGLLSERRWQVYDMLVNNGPCTASELSEFLPNKLSRTIGSNVHARLGELRDFGVAKEVGTKTCKISGQKVIVWDIVDAIPVKYEKQKKIKCKHCNGKGFHIEQQSKMF